MIFRQSFDKNNINIVRSRVFHKYKSSLFVNGIEIVVVYGPYKDRKETFGILEAFPLKCRTTLYILRGKKFQTSGMLSYELSDEKLIEIFHFVC